MNSSRFATLKKNYGWKKLTMEISHPYHSVVNKNQADKYLFTHKTIDLESKKDRVIKIIENTAIITQEGDKILLDPINQSGRPKLIYAQTVEGDRSCTYFPAKKDANMQIFEDNLSINQSNHSYVIYAQPLAGDITSIFPANSLDHSEASIN